MSRYRAEMNVCCVRARAKVNLALDVLYKRDDGYHELSSVMQTLLLHDVITIKKVFKPNYLKLVTNVPWLPTDDKNLAYKAARFLKESYDIGTGIFIDITKQIPTSAGLGGGSADCAATLVGIRNLFALPIRDEQLVKLSVRFGADVPFCVQRGIALAEGIGERLTPLPRLPHMHIVIARPPILCSTKEVFSAYRHEDVSERPDMEKLVYAIKRKQLKDVFKNMGNSLEHVTIKKHPIVQTVKDNLMANGASVSLMTGSGPTVFGIFMDRRQAVRAAKAVSQEFEFEDVFVTRPF